MNNRTRKPGGGAVLIIGATSAIARALAARFAGLGYDLILAARDQPELSRVANDLHIRHGVTVEARYFDICLLDRHEAFFHEAAAQFESGLFAVVLCQGVMNAQPQAEHNFELALQMIQTNYTASASLLNLAAHYFELRRAGQIVAVSSVAGDRGRQSNYIYGSTKAALNVLLQGVRQRLKKFGVGVLTVKPGFTDTAMTWGLPGLFLLATPDRVARDVLHAMQAGKAEIYTPWFWRWIMLIIRMIPEAIFNRLKL